MTISSKVYTIEEAKAASRKFFSEEELPADVFVSKYALRDHKGNLYEKTPADTAVRLAKEFARVEKKFPNPLTYKEIYKQLMNVSEYVDNDDELVNYVTGYGSIIPQGSPTSAIGNPYQIQSLSNCFVIDSPKDSYGGILFTDQEQAQIMKRRGGVGFDISNIRPKGLTTNNAARTTDGIGVFMERFSNTCREVAQGGRRGALMLTISINHPEVATFINIKRDKSKVTGANVSIRVTDEFMKAVENDEEFVHRWPVNVPPEEAKIVKKVKAKELWNLMIDAAWYAAEPGILFWDTVERETPSDAYQKFGFKSASTNPCGEIVLPEGGDSCRLICLNLKSFVKNAWKENAFFDYDLFDKTSMIAQQIMDDLIELEIEAVDRILNKIKSDPEPDDVKSIELNLWNKVRKMAVQGRRTGLGITALGDVLAMIGVKYGSDESINVVEKIYKTLGIASYKSSIDMAKNRGAFPIWDWKLDMSNQFLKKIYNELPIEYQKKWEKFGRRNIANTTTAPVGSMSILLNSTNGIEPLFAKSWTRRRKVDPGPNVKVDFVDQNGDSWQEYTMYHKGIKDWMEATGNTDVNNSPYAGACSEDIKWTMGTKLQAAAQRWICHSISRTANLPKNVSHDIVSDLYLDAWKEGCKGFTVYRDGSRTGVLLTQNASKNWMEGVPDEELQKMIDISNSSFLNTFPDKYLEFINEVKNELNHRKDSSEIITSFNSLPTSYNDVKKRPKKLLCDIKRATVIVNKISQTYMILVGLLDGKPYEIFCGLSKHVDLPKKYTSGWIIKNGRKKGNIATYNLIIGEGDDKIIFNDIVEQFDNPVYGAFSRTLSLALRHNIPIQYIVEQLQKDKNSGITSWSRAISRILKNYIPDGVNTTLDKLCPNCNSKSLVYQQGCPSCQSCGWTKCL
jgi:ribonucleoside-diphosphate reductase alpha chain